MHSGAGRARKTPRSKRDVERISEQLQDIAADTREAMAHARDLQAQLQNLAMSVLKAAAQLQEMRR